MQLKLVRRTQATALDTFARRVTQSRIIWTVSGSEGLSRVPSPIRRGREVNLLWSTREEAGRWMTRFAKPRLNPITLRNTFEDVLPKLRSLNRLIGPDWPPDGRPDLEWEPAELERRLQEETANYFIDEATRTGAVWVLEDEMGPAFAASHVQRGGLALPCWSSRQGAESQCSGFWSEMLVSRIELDRFTARTLPWLIELGRRLAPNFGQSAPVEVGARELAARFKPVRRPGAA